jgi:hypothetical protein
MVQNPPKNSRKKFKKNIFLGIYPCTKSPFLGPQLVPGTTIEKINKKTQVVPGTKYGVFRYITNFKIFKILRV